MSARQLAELFGPAAVVEVGWMGSGACTGVAHSLFFPGKGDHARQAKAVCGSCSVQTECARYALVHHIRHGVWGGLTERERRAYREFLTGAGLASVLHPSTDG